MTASLSVILERSVGDPVLVFTGFFVTLFLKMTLLFVILTPKAEDYSEGECCKNEFTHFYNRAKE